VLSHLEDLESDFSVFHRVDDMYAVPTRRFLAWAGRLVNYDGALRAAARSDEPEAGARRSSATMPVPATRLAYDSHPELRGLGTFAEVPKPAVLTAEQQAYVDAHPELQVPPRR
jgi:hypothetical protein